MLMDRSEIRLECLKIAMVRSSYGHLDVINTAAAYEDFVVGSQEEDKKNLPKKKTGNSDRQS